MGQSRIDLCDLKLLKEVRLTRSLTAASERLGLSQPAVSVRLGHLRKHFADPLFVRTSDGMMSTPFLESLIPDIEQAMGLLSPKDGPHKPFDALNSTRRFRVGLSHVAQMVVLPELLARLQVIAPKVRIDSLDLDASTPAQLESGELDLAMGYAPNLHSGFFQQRLFDESYYCIFRADHPRIAGPLTKAMFLEEEHVAVVAPATGHSRLDKVLEERGAERKVAVKVSSFLGIERIVRSTNLLAVVPSSLGKTIALSGHVRAVELPIPSLSYEVRQYWHGRFHYDTGNGWLRSVFFEKFSNLPQSGFLPI